MYRVRHVMYRVHLFHVMLAILTMHSNFQYSQAMPQIQDFILPYEHVLTMSPVSFYIYQAV